MTKYVLDYLREELFIEPVEFTHIGLEEEYEGEVPIGYRLILNNKDVDIVVWYADLNKWFINKYEELKSKKQ